MSLLLGLLQPFWAASSALQDAISLQMSRPRREGVTLSASPPTASQRPAAARILGSASPPPWQGTGPRWQRSQLRCRPVFGSSSVPSGKSAVHPNLAAHPQGVRSSPPPRRDWDSAWEQALGRRLSAHVGWNEGQLVAGTKGSAAKEGSGSGQGPRKRAGQLVQAVRPSQRQAPKQGRGPALSRDSGGASRTLTGATGTHCQLGPRLTGS